MVQSVVQSVHGKVIYLSNQLSLLGSSSGGCSEESSVSSRPTVLGAVLSPCLQNKKFWVNWSLYNPPCSLSPRNCVTCLLCLQWPAPVPSAWMTLQLLLLVSSLVKSWGGWSAAWKSWGSPHHLETQANILSQVDWSGGPVSGPVCPWECTNLKPSSWGSSLCAPEQQLLWHVSQQQEAESSWVWPSMLVPVGVQAEGVQVVQLVVWSAGLQHLCPPVLCLQWEKIISPWFLTFVQTCKKQTISRQLETGRKTRRGRQHAIVSFVLFWLCGVTPSFQAGFRTWKKSCLFSALPLFLLLYFSNSSDQ